jgi:DNA-binding response OmpR family regulator
MQRGVDSTVRILVIEDNRHFAANLVDFFESRGHQADAAADGLTGLHLAATQNYDALVLDLGLPGMDGHALCDRLRRAGCNVPVLMLTARGELEDKLRGLRGGADDYVVKPVALAELEARLDAQVRRASGALARSRLCVGDLELDQETMEVRRGGLRIELTRIDFEILKILLRASPKVVTRRQLEAEVWGDKPPDSDALRVHIHLLRKAIDRSFGRPLLHTVHGVGYRLVKVDALSP